MQGVRTDAAMTPRLSPEEIRALLNGLDTDKLAASVRSGGGAAGVIGEGTVPTPAELMGLGGKLTELLSHWEFELWLVRRLEQARVLGQQVALLRIELDHDHRLGEQGAGQDLSWLAWALGPGLPDEDVRFGDEHHCTVILPNAGPEQAMATAGRLKDKMTQRLLRAAGRAGSTLSLGLAVFPTDSGDALELLNMAEVALYQAKWAGGDRICLWGLGRRGAKRQPVKIGLGIRPAGRKSRQTMVYTNDLSLSGCSVTSPKALKTGRLFVLELPGVNSEDPMFVAGSCVWSDPGEYESQAGIAFELDEGQQEKILQLVD